VPNETGVRGADAVAARDARGVSIASMPQLSPSIPTMRQLRLAIPALVLSALLVGAGCGDSDTIEAGEPVPFRLAETGLTPLGDIPWPSDLYLDDSGHIGEVPGIARVASASSTIANGLRQLDGFGRSTGAVFFVDSDVDPDSLPNTWDEANAARASVFFVDLDPASPAFGTRYPAYGKFLPSLACISVIPVPGIVLPPGVRHAAVLTRRVRTTAGLSLVADAELARIAGLDSPVTPAERLYGDALDRLVETDAVRRAGDVAALAVFTTSRRAFDLPRLRDVLHEQPAPALLLDPGNAAPYTTAIFGVATTPSLGDWLGTPDVDENGLEWPGGDNAGGIAHDQIGAVASGAFVAPSFLDRGARRFLRDPVSGEYRLAEPEAKIPVTLVVPRQPPPPGGYPVVIHGHGLSNHRGSMLGVANELARAGFAMIGIDDVLHGTRLTSTRDRINIYPGTWDGPDGIPDTTPFPVSFFAGFADFVTMTDNFRQTVLDQTSLVRLIRNPDLDLAPLADAVGGFTPVLDPERIYWSGGSLGGIIGSTTLAVEPEIAAAALQVPGAGFLQFITTNSAELSPLVGGLATATLGVQGSETIDEFHPVALLLATITEGGDPIAYAPHVFADPLLPERTPPDVLVTWAPYDEVLPNIATVALIRAFGLDFAAPNLFALPGIGNAAAPVVANHRSGRTAAAVQYMPANHGLGYGRFDTRKFLPGPPADGAGRPKLAAEFRFEQPIREHTTQLVTFFASVADGGPAVIDMTRAPRADYDGDGSLDAAELAAGTDPHDPASR
jgi:hypothetical protein